MSHVIFVMLVLRIGIGSTKNLLVEAFLIYLYHFICLLDIVLKFVRRNTVLVTHRSKEGSVFSALITLSEILLLCDIIIFSDLQMIFLFLVLLL